MEGERFPLRRVIVVSLLVILTITGICTQTGTINIVKRFLAMAAVTPKSSCILDLLFTYKTCGHNVELQRPFQSEELLKNALQEYPGLKIKKHEPTRWKGIVIVEGLCDTCRNYQFLSIRGRKVVVLRGIPARPGPVLEITQININRLPESEQKDLRKGIPFKDSKEKLQLIEGLDGLMGN